MPDRNITTISISRIVAACTIAHSIGLPGLELYLTIELATGNSCVPICRNCWILADFHLDTAVERPFGLRFHWPIECCTWEGDGDQRLPNALKGDLMFLTLFVILLLAWIMGFVAFHVAGGLIHLLLIVAVISLVLHFVRGGRTIA
jgi:hypothetical protein